MWPPECFLCVQCLQPFPKDVFFIKDGRHYCEHDFLVLFGNKCSGCGRLIEGAYVTANGLKARVTAGTGSCCPLPQLSGSAMWCTLLLAAGRAAALLSHGSWLSGSAHSVCCHR